MNSKEAKKKNKLETPILSKKFQLLSLVIVKNNYTKRGNINIK